MSNHYHVVMHIDQARAVAWPDDEVIKRWTTLYKGPGLMQRHLAGDMLSVAEKKELTKIIQACREKLCSLSRFMACMNEFIARKANREDGCTGRFWEGRFTSQALLDESALLSCMAYVDLNPIRAGLADDLEASDFTSIQDRIRQVQGKLTVGKTPIGKTQKTNANPPRLMPFKERLRESDTFAAIPYNLRDYLDLVDWTGRSIRPGKRSHIRQSKPKLLWVLGISESQWRTLALDIQKQSITMLNGLNTLAQIEKKADKARAA